MIKTQVNTDVKILKFLNFKVTLSLVQIVRLFQKFLNFVIIQDLIVQLKEII
jgi:hypothetical protein